MQLTNHSFAIRLFISVVWRKSLHHFRHVSHVYSARLAKELLIILPLGLLVILLGNFLQPLSQFDIARQNILANPADSQSHAFLAQQFFVTNQITEAKAEAQLTNTPKLLQKIQNIKTQPDEVQKKIIRLQKIAEQFPNYRDAYIQLAIFNWKLYRPFDVQKYLEKALEIDPNNEVANKILGLVK